MQGLLLLEVWNPLSSVWHLLSHSWEYWVPVLTLFVGYVAGRLVEGVRRELQMMRLATGIPVPAEWRKGDVRVALDGEALARTQMGEAALVVRSFEGHGSGVCISSAGLVLTNAHVVGDSSMTEIGSASGEWHLAAVVKVDKKRDVALLKPQARLGHAVKAAFSLPKVGDDLYISGAPLHPENKTFLTKGIVSKVGPFPGTDQDFVQTDCPIAPGNSGGPAFNAQGELVGISVAVVMSGGQQTHIGLVIPINECLRALRLKSQ